MRVVLLVTHLLGTGHLARALVLARAVQARGHAVQVLSGGMPAPHLDRGAVPLVQLPPVRADGPEFRGLLDQDGNPVDSALFEARIQTVREALLRDDPDVLVTELFPFGRRKLAAEFHAAIDAVGGRALICASIRDILQAPRKAGRKEDADRIFADRYHAALFHGDPALLPLSESWPLDEDLAAKVHPTGYIGGTCGKAAPAPDGRGRVLVAAGGGAAGDALFEAATRAASRAPQIRFHLLVGGADASRRIDRLREMASATATRVEPIRPDFRALLAACDAAILQCGYNTAMDVVACNARAAFVPFEGPGGETEQLTRARAFAERFGASLLRESELDPESLLSALTDLRARNRPDFSAIATDGAERSADLLDRLWREHRR